jgi:hypothetical protein
MRERDLKERERDLKRERERMTGRGIYFEGEDLRERKIQRDILKGERGIEVERERVRKK